MAKLLLWELPSDVSYPASCLHYRCGVGGASTTVTVPTASVFHLLRVALQNLFMPLSAPRI